MQIDSAHLRYAAAAAATSAPSRAEAARTVPEAPRAGAASTAPVDTIELSIPASPPPDVLEAMAAAAERAAELAANNRELHFRPDEHSSRIIIEVRDMAGNVLRTIPPSKALDVLTTALERDARWLA